MASVSARSAWWLAIRPATLTASAAPVLVGTGAAWATARSPRAGDCGAGGASLLQVGANFANDVFDFERGADNADRLGPAARDPAGVDQPAQISAHVARIEGAAVGMYLTAVAGWPVLALGLLRSPRPTCQGGPRPYGYLGLGDLSVFIFFGPGAVAGAYFVQALGVAARAGRVHPDRCARYGDTRREQPARHRDRCACRQAHAGRAARRRPDAQLYLILLVVAYAVPLLLRWRGLAGAWVMLPWLSLPLGIELARRMRHERGLALNGCLVRTAHLEVVFGLLFALGLAW